jgi:hypothetical protein
VCGVLPTDLRIIDLFKTVAAEAGKSHALLDQWEALVKVLGGGASTPLGGDGMGTPLGGVAVVAAAASGTEEE